MSERTTGVLMEVRREREAQERKWGDQAHPDGTGGEFRACEREQARHACQLEAKDPGGPTWRAILDEEVAETLAESDPLLLREELVQVAAVCVAWVEDLDRRPWERR